MCYSSKIKKLVILTMVDSQIKVNGINETINKFNTKVEIINLDKFKEEFKLDSGEYGFYRLSLSYNRMFGDTSILETYNRPPIGPLPFGTFCTICRQRGYQKPDGITDPSKAILGQDHKETCEKPEDSSLNLTVIGVYNQIVNKLDYKGDYKWIQDISKVKGNFSRENLADLLLNDDIIGDSEGEDINGQRVLTFDYLLEKYPTAITEIPYIPIRRGPAKLSRKTSTAHFLNNIVIYYSLKPNRLNPEGHKTSIRISKNGLINVINVSQNPEERMEMLNELIKRINDLPAGAVNIKKFNEASKSEPPLTEYSIIPKYSYYHSISGQFSLWEGREREIDFSSLNNIVSPFNQAGKIMNGKYSRVETLPNGRQIINLSNGEETIRIIEWVYSVGRLTRNQIMSKEYIKFISIPVPGIKLTVIINKFGTFQMTLSKCHDGIIVLGLCPDNKNAVVLPEYFNNIYKVFSSIFSLEGDLLSSTSLQEILASATKQNVTNTANGRQPASCRKTRPREGYEGVEYMRPRPYSWYGVCSDPNYQYVKPEGLPDTKDKSGILQYYPCCSKKPKDMSFMRLYLIHGFPLPGNMPGGINEVTAKNKGIPPAGQEDLSSGIFPPGKGAPGAITLVNVPEEGLQEVKIIKKKSLSSNEYSVQKVTRNESGEIILGDIINVKGTDFFRQSRRFRGLTSFKKEELLSCISGILNLNVGDVMINEYGEIIKTHETIFNTVLDRENKRLFDSLITRRSNFKMLSYPGLKDFLTKSFVLKGVTADSYHFYLVLSPSGNFYISDSGKSFSSEISETFEKIIVLDGFLERPNYDPESDSGNDFKNKYHVLDVLYFDNTVQTGGNREKLLLEIKSFYLNDSDQDELIYFPEEISDIIAGAYELLISDKNTMLIFMNSVECCDYIIWNPLFKPQRDEIVLQVISQPDATKLIFGFRGQPLSSSVGSGFTDKILKPIFSKKDISALSIKKEDYLVLRINRDSNGDIVPQRVFTLLNKLDPSKIPEQTFEDSVENLSLIVNPIKEEFFTSSTEDWITPSGKMLQYDPIYGRLKEFVLI